MSQHLHTESEINEDGREAHEACPPRKLQRVAVDKAEAAGDFPTLGCWNHSTDGRHCKTSRINEKQLRPATLRGEVPGGRAQQSTHPKQAEMQSWGEGSHRAPGVSAGKNPATRTRSAALYARQYYSLKAARRHSLLQMSCLSPIEHLHRKDRGKPDEVSFKRDAATVQRKPEKEVSRMHKAVHKANCARTVNTWPPALQK